jgi:glycosyltransferase involved in cell wall biosynthesis
MAGRTAIPPGAGERPRPVTAEVGPGRARGARDAGEPDGRPEAAGRPGLSLLVVLPALDEAPTIGRVIRGIPREIRGVASVEVLVVDDGSADGTAEEARRAGARVIRHGAPRGVGGAFHSALAYALDQRADLLVSIDADGQFDPADIPALVAPVIAGEADFATASRFKDPALTPRMPRARRWGNRMMSRLVSSLTGQRLHDVSCGMRCYSRAAALQLYPVARFTYTQEVFLNLVSRQLRIVEVPIRVRGEREFGRSRVAASLWRYGLRTAVIIVRSYRDYWPLQFFGALALGLLGLATALGGFFLVHYARTGQFRPHTWAGVAAGACVGLAGLMVHMGLVGDMLNRHRLYLEELLYRQREGPRRPPPPD